MKYESDLKHIEKQVYLLFHKDGLIDIAIGLCILFAWLVMELDLYYLWIPLTILTIIAWQLLKRTVTLPRIGQTKYSKERKYKNSILIGLAFFSCISLLAMGIMLFFFYGGPEASGDLNVLLLDEVQLVTGIFTVVLLGFSALVLGLSRFFLYSSFAVAALLVNQLTGIMIWSTYFYVGTVIVFAGLFQLIRFIKQYSTIDVDSIDDLAGEPHEK